MEEHYLITDQYTHTTTTPNTIQPKGYNDDGKWIGYKAWYKLRYGWIEDKQKQFIKDLHNVPIIIAEGTDSGVAHIYTDPTIFINDPHNRLKQQ